MKSEKRIATQTDLAFIIVIMKKEKQIEIRLIINHFFENVKYPYNAKGRVKKTTDENRFLFVKVEYTTSTPGIKYRPLKKYCINPILDIIIELIIIVLHTILILFSLLFRIKTAAMNRIPYKITFDKSKIPSVILVVFIKERTEKKI